MDTSQIDKLLKEILDGGMDPKKAEALLQKFGKNTSAVSTAKDIGGKMSRMSPWLGLLSSQEANTGEDAQLEQMLANAEQSEQADIIMDQAELPVEDGASAFQGLKPAQKHSLDKAKNPQSKYTQDKMDERIDARMRERDSVKEEMNQENKTLEKRVNKRFGETEAIRTLEQLRNLSR